MAKRNRPATPVLTRSTRIVAPEVSMAANSAAIAFHRVGVEKIPTDVLQRLCGVRVTD